MNFVAPPTPSSARTDTGNSCMHVGYDEFNPDSWPSECAPTKQDWIVTGLGLCGDGNNYPEGGIYTPLLNWRFDHGYYFAPRFHLLEKVKIIYSTFYKAIHQIITHISPMRCLLPSRPFCISFQSTGTAPISRSRPVSLRVPTGLHSFREQSPTYLRPRVARFYVVSRYSLSVGCVWLDPPHILSISLTSYGWQHNFVPLRRWRSFGTCFGAVRDGDN